MIMEDVINFGYDKDMLQALQEKNPEMNKAQIIRLAIDQWLEYIVE